MENNGISSSARRQGSRRSDDPEAVERRLWYDERMKDAIATLDKRSHIAPWNLSSHEYDGKDDDCSQGAYLGDDFENSESKRSYLEQKKDSKSLSAPSKSLDGSNENPSSSLIQLGAPSSSTSVVEEAQPKKSAFKSDLLDLVDEGIARQQAIYAAPKGRTLSIKKYEHPGENFQPRKWLYPLNAAAKNALLTFRGSRQTAAPTSEGAKRDLDSSSSRRIATISQPSSPKRPGESSIVEKKSNGTPITRKKKRKILMCCHGLACNHLYFEPWATPLSALEKEQRAAKLNETSQVDSDIELWSVCLPGRSGRFLEPVSDSVHVLAGCVGDAMASLGLLSATGLLGAADEGDGSSICLFGHSLGGLIAFETARSLKARYDFDISFLYISCIPAPFAVCDANRDTYVARRSELSEQLLLKKMSDLGDPVFNDLYSSRAVVENDVVRVEEPLNSGVRSRKYDLLQMFLPLLRADFRLLESYVMDLYLEKIARGMEGTAGSEQDGRSGAGLKYCHLTSVVTEDDSVIVGDDYKGKNNSKITKIVKKGTTPADTAQSPVGPKGTAREKIGQDYIDSIADWGQQLSGGAVFRDGCEYFHIQFEEGGHHHCLLHEDNMNVLLADIIHKMA